MLAHGSTARHVALLTCYILLVGSLEVPTDLARQSLVFPQSHKSIQDDWYYGGGAHLRHGSGSLISSVVLNAGVADHPAMLFGYEPVPSDNFEASFVVDIRPADVHNDGFIYEGLAFWYVKENHAEVRKINNENEKKRRMAKVKGQRFGLFGYKNNYNGLGAFVFFDAGSPMLTAIQNSGQKKVSHSDVFGALYGLGLYDIIFGQADAWESADEQEKQQNPERLDADPLDPLDPLGAEAEDAKKGAGVSEIEVKLRVGPRFANVSVPGVGTLAFDLEGPHPGKGGYLGVTAVSYAARRDPHLKPIGIELKALKVVDFGAAEELQQEEHSDFEAQEEL